MSVAIIRNEKKKISEITGLYNHNRRRYKNHSNEKINSSKTKDNYFIKQCPTTYTTQITKLIQKYNLLDTTKTIKKNRVVACELVITSDEDYFKSISPEEAKRYFQEAFNFVSKYKGLTDEFIIDAVVHLDETTPHMHLLYMPVIHSKDIESGKDKIKLASSEFWKGQNSYGKLQDLFWEHIHSKGFNLERGEKGSKSEHYSLEDFKRITKLKTDNLPTEFKEIETPIKSNNKKLIKEDYLRVIKKCNSMTGTFNNLNQELNNYIKAQRKLQKENENKIIELTQELSSKIVENENLKELNSNLNKFIDRACLFVNEKFNLTKEKFIFLVNTFKTEQEKITEQLLAVQNKIHRNFSHLNKKSNMKGKDKNE